MKQMGRWSILAIGVAAVMMCTSVLADPLPGQFVKFRQMPMDGVLINGVSYWGHDEVSTAWWTEAATPLYEGDFMADDFSDSARKDVVHVRWWGSYINYQGEIDPLYGIQQFLIAFEHDIPADLEEPDSYSMPDSTHPGNLYQIVNRMASGPVAPGALPSTLPGTFTEKWLALSTPRPAEELYEYNAELYLPFPQQPDTVYWLKIVALRGPQEEPISWGWHNRDYTVKDLFASPKVVLGEHTAGWIPDPSGGPATPIWHHQDNAVDGWVSVMPLAASPQVEVVEDVYGPTHYVNEMDGPGYVTNIPCWPGIGAFSKDLAFELYAIPEPSTGVLLAIGVVFLVGWIRRRR